MVVAPDLFIGLVTFPGTRFVQARTDKGLAAQLTRWLPKYGISTKVSIQEEDLLNPNDFSVSVARVRDAIDAELLIEREWREYLSGKKASVPFRLLLLGRKLWRRFKWTPPWQRSSTPSDASARSLIRLANIELSHLAIVDAAVESQARWCLILEDDAQINDPQNFARELSVFIRNVEAANHDVSMINLSESFTPEQLGIAPLLHPVAPSPTEYWTLFTSSRHITNTVCAVLYRRDFLQALRAQLLTIPLEPVVPIDFKINSAIARGGQALPGKTWVCSPAPITQASGVPTPAINIHR